MKTFLNRSFLFVSTLLFFIGTPSVYAHHGHTNELVEITSVPEKFEDFTTTDLQGNTVKLSDYEGKVIFLNFWATWCIPCRTEMPAMKFLEKNVNDPNFVILTVNMKESPEKIKIFNTELKLNFKTLLDPEGEVFNLYRVTTLPTTFVIDKQGLVIARAVGPRDWGGKKSINYFKHLLAQEIKAPKGEKSGFPFFKDLFGK